MPVMIKQTSAAVVNLSILSADFYAILAGLLLFKYSVSDNDLRPDNEDAERWRRRFFARSDQFRKESSDLV